MRSGIAGFTDRCAFFLIWGYFIIHLVILRPWGCKLPFLFQFLFLLAWCPTEKKIQNLFDGACHPLMVHHHSDCVHHCHYVSLYRLPNRRRPLLGKTESGRSTTTYMPEAGSRLRPQPAKACGYCIRFTTPAATVSCTYHRASPD